MNTFRLAWGLAWVLPLAACGCGGRPLPPQADPAQAKTALHAALDAWQAGEPADSMQQRKPPIYFNDPKRQADVQLVKYQVDENQEFHGQSVRLQTTLSLKFADGSVKDRKAAYLVDTSPAIVIVPD